MQEPLITISLSEYERLKRIEEKYKKKRQEEINEIIVDARVRACEVLKKEMEEAIENCNLSPFRNYSNRYLK
ncbi:hypothetical protein IGK74_002376 [Enterococcus sp. AZ150]|uniref:hypothetical protein n=1 Tax=Enterococcus sp. AZ150 TaxID=2774866 RepID=UPI003F276896